MWTWTGNGTVFLAIYRNGWAQIISTSRGDYLARYGYLTHCPDDGTPGIKTIRGGWIIESREPTFEAAEHFCKARLGCAETAD